MTKKQEQAKPRPPQIRQAEPDREKEVLARPVVIKLAEYRENEPVQVGEGGQQGLVGNEKEQKKSGPDQRQRPPIKKIKADDLELARPEEKPDREDRPGAQVPAEAPKQVQSETGSIKTAKTRAKSQAKDKSRTSPEQAKPSPAKGRSLRQDIWTQVKALPRVTYVMLLILVLITLFVTLPAFRIQEVEVQDVHFIPQDELFAASGLKMKQHFLSGLGGTFSQFISGRYGDAEKSVMAQIPQADDVVIKYNFPGKLLIRLNEKIEIGWLEIPGGYCTIDSKGKVIAIKQTRPTGLPVIAGLSIVKAKLGQQIEVDQTDYLENAMCAMSALIEADVDLAGDKLLDRITKIEPTIRNDIYFSLSYDQKDFKVVCNRSHDLVADFIWLKQMVNSKALADKPAGLVDLRGKERLFKKNSQSPTEPGLGEDGLPSQSQASFTDQGEGQAEGQLEDQLGVPYEDQGGGQYNQEVIGQGVGGLD